MIRCFWRDFQRKGKIMAFRASVQLLGCVTVWCRAPEQVCADEIFDTLPRLLSGVVLDAMRHTKCRPTPRANKLPFSLPKPGYDTDIIGVPIPLLSAAARLRAAATARSAAHHHLAGRNIVYQQRAEFARIADR